MIAQDNFLHNFEKNKKQKKNKKNSRLQDAALKSLVCVIWSYLSNFTFSFFLITHKRNFLINENMLLT